MARLLSVLLLPSTVHGLYAALPRYAIEFPTDIVLHRAADEPAFVPSNVKTCTLNRLQGYSLNTPGYSHGHPGANQVRTTATWLNGSAVCPVHAQCILHGPTPDATSMLECIHNALSMHPQYMLNAGRLSCDGAGHQGPSLGFGGRRHQGSSR